MSLINEALRKARQEAARRDGADHGRLPPPGPMVNEGGGRFGTGLVLGAVIAVAAALVGAGLVWLVLRGAESGREVQPERLVMNSPPPVVAGEPSAPLPGSARRPAATEIVDVASEGGEPVPAGGEDLVEMAHGSVRSGDGGEQVPGTNPVSEADDPAPAAAVESSIKPEVRQPASGGERREFFAEADLGYVTLSLDYIVFRDTDPFAQINGEVVHVGGVVEGFDVVAVARDHVWLRDDRGPLILKVR